MNKFDKIVDIIFEKSKKKSRLERLLDNCDEANKAGGYESVKEVCRNTKGEAAAAIYLFVDEVILHNK